MQMLPMSSVRRGLSLGIAVAIMVLAGCANPPPQSMAQKKLGQAEQVRELQFIANLAPVIRWHKDKASLDNYYQFAGAELARMLEAKGIKTSTVLNYAPGGNPIGAVGGPATHLVVLSPESVEIQGGPGTPTSVWEIVWIVRVYEKRPGGGVSQGGLQLLLETKFKFNQGIARVPIEAIWKPRATEFATFIHQQLREAGV